ATASSGSSRPRTANTTTTASSSALRRSNRRPRQPAPMKIFSLLGFWKNLGLISRLMLAVGVAIITGGGVQTALLVAEGAGEHSARLLREQNETLAFVAPLVADQAIVGDYAAISQLLRNQVKKGEVDRFSWTDKDGKTL